MTTIQSIRTTLHVKLTKQIDPEYLTKIRELVPSEWTILGVRVPVLQAIAKELKKEHRSFESDDLVMLLDDAFADRCREEVLVYLFWLATMKRQLNSSLWSSIDHWVGQIVDWETCDQLATKVAAVIVDQTIVDGEPKLVDELIGWTKSDYVWRRRFPAATASALNQKGRAHVAETLRICENLMQDDDAMVRKAVGWALREASKRDEQTVFEFLTQWKTIAPRGLLRESAQKLSEPHQVALLE
ncbi:DNA alkylation repair protein [Chloroflexi bacterium TSY]|nr:DNA alkylation repair protein [Chloroflexi bacterium TSY]